MYDADLRKMRQVGIIQVFVEYRDRLIDGHANQVDLRRYAEGLGHLDLAASASGSAGTTRMRAGKSRSGDGCFLDHFQIADIDEGAQNSHLYIQIALGVRQGADGSL